MADNVAITAGTGTSVATDEISSVHYQRNKLSLGADGSATDAVGGAGAVSAAVQRVTLASDDVLVAKLPAALGAGGGLKIDGSGTAIPVTGTFYQATQPISGSVGVTGSVAVTGTFWQATQPVSLASLPALAAGTALVGKVGVDQTTDGTTNKVNIDASLKSGTATRASVNSGTSSVTILASNANRKGAVIVNSDANALLLDLSGGTAASTRYQARLTQYQTYELPAGYTGAITGIWEADGSGVADVVEFT